jgi:four helix bundle protein
MQSYKELLVWQVAMGLANEVHRITRQFPREEMYGLISQIRRSAVSVPSNIAEGQGRATRGEFIQFLGHARGSLFELETQLTIAGQLGYVKSLDQTRILATLTRVAQLLNGLMTSLRPSTQARSTIHDPRSTTA